MPAHNHMSAPRNTIETYSARPEREPPKNENGEIYCQHPDCVDKKETFRRPCEWNKHMDKHERPYKCNEPTCEQNPGFTYSGGLLRHMREVHKKGVGPARKPLFCPHSNCIRSTGEGFTRRENLEEHLRRRHSFNGHYSPPPENGVPDENGEATEDGPRKRLKTGEPESPTAMQGQFALPSRRDTDLSGTTALLAQLDPQAFLNGEADLPQEEVIRQLALARAQIAQQQQTIAMIQRRNYELEFLLSQRQNGTGVHNSLASQLEMAAVQDPRLHDQNALQLLKMNGSYPPIPQQYDPQQGTPGAESNPQAQSHAGEKDDGTASKDSNADAARQVEIAKDLLTDRTNAAQSAPIDAA